MLIIEESICEFRSPSCHICHIYRFCPILLKSDFQKCSLPYLAWCLSTGLGGSSSKQLRKLNFIEAFWSKVSKTMFYLRFKDSCLKIFFETILLRGALKNFMRLLDPHIRRPKLKKREIFHKNIATGETSQAITPYHFFKCSYFFGFYH